MLIDVDKAIKKLRASGLVVEKIGHKSHASIAGGKPPKHFSGKPKLSDLDYSFYIHPPQRPYFHYTLVYDGNIPSATPEEVEGGKFARVHGVPSLEKAVELLLILKQTGLYGAEPALARTYPEQPDTAVAEALLKLQTAVLFAQKVVQPNGDIQITGGIQPASAPPALEQAATPAVVNSNSNSKYNFTIEPATRNQYERWLLSYSGTIPPNATENQVEKGKFKVTHSMLLLSELVDLLLVLQQTGLYPLE